ncbi:MAG: hypothetical protein IJ664_08590, partial [Clostridia bacterium]|nr:hypothetical protein [Clostridia bacterium]
RTENLSGMKIPSRPGKRAFGNFLLGDVHLGLPARLTLKTCHRHVFRALQARLRIKNEGAAAPSCIPDFQQ